MMCGCREVLVGVVYNEVLNKRVLLRLYEQV